MNRRDFLKDISKLSLAIPFIPFVNKLEFPSGFPEDVMPQVQVGCNMNFQPDVIFLMNGNTYINDDSNGGTLKMVQGTLDSSIGFVVKAG